FLASTAFLPVVAWLMARGGPRLTIPVGGALVALGFLAARWVTTPLELYLAFGLLAVNGSMAMSYIGHSMFLPNWFVRNRGLAVGVAFAGVGVLGAGLLPALQWAIDTQGWRTACLWVAGVVAVAVIPLNALFQRARPEDMGLHPDGDAAPRPGGPAPVEAVVDRAWADTDWTLGRALRTRRFWLIALAYFCGLFVWYALQVHHTRHLQQAGFDGETTAAALGLIALGSVAGQIGLGALSDRLGRELAWSLALLGFAGASALMLAITRPDPALLWTMVAVQGLIGQGFAALFGAIPAEVFAGKRFPAIFSAISLIANMGAAAGVFGLGWLFDLNGDYAAGFRICVALSLLSIALMWLAAPRKVRLVAGVARRRAAA
ncbi:MAG: MFS transporter, partial [Pseudomonadota bacterium]